MAFFNKRTTVNISVIGLGYVGLVTAVCLAKLGYSVLAIDADHNKISTLENGNMYILEPDLSDALSLQVANSTLSFSCYTEFTLGDVIFVCVGTPLVEDDLDHAQIESVLIDIYVISARNQEEKIVSIRSTINPEKVLLIESKLQKKYPTAQVHIVSNPEFMRETSAIADFFSPPFVIVGGKKTNIVKKILTLYQPIQAQKFAVDFHTAALIKLACNAFHATKIVFANEIARICDHLNINATQVMSILASDKKLNCSENYLRPGFAFGGSCLPKDLKQIIKLAKNSGNTEFFDAIYNSNKKIIDDTVASIIKNKPASIAILGITFKNNTNDIRQSPYVNLAKKIITHGIKVNIFDNDADSVKQQLIESFKNNCHLVSFCDSQLDAIAHVESIIVAKKACFDSKLTNIEQLKIPIFDLERSLGISSSD